MDSKILCALVAIVGLTACEQVGTEVSGDPYGYWYPTHVTADNTPDILHAQDFLEQDLAECGYEVQQRNHLAKVNDPVSTSDGHVVDEKGTARSDTWLPTDYALWQCMDAKGWVKLKHYYTVPY